MLELTSNVCVAYIDPIKLTFLSKSLPTPHSKSASKAVHFAHPMNTYLSLLLFTVYGRRSKAPFLLRFS